MHRAVGRIVLVSAAVLLPLGWASATAQEGEEGNRGWTGGFEEVDSEVCRVDEAGAGAPLEPPFFVPNVDVRLREGRQLFWRPALYTNPLGDVFRFDVWGADERPLLEYTDSVQVCFDDIVTRGIDLTQIESDQTAPPDIQFDPDIELVKTPFPFVDSREDIVVDFDFLGIGEPVAPLREFLAMLARDVHPDDWLPALLDLRAIEGFEDLEDPVVSEETEEPEGLDAVSEETEEPEGYVVPGVFAQNETPDSGTGATPPGEVGFTSAPAFDNADPQNHRIDFAVDPPINAGAKHYYWAVRTWCAWANVYWTEGGQGRPFVYHNWAGTYLSHCGSSLGDHNLIVVGGESWGRYGVSGSWYRGPWDPRP
jgi:hypothetical protein